VAFWAQEAQLLTRELLDLDFPSTMQNLDIIINIPP
jgi:hypothetical protein